MILSLSLLVRDKRLFSSIAFHCQFGLALVNYFLKRSKSRLAPVLKIIHHQCVISYTCSKSNSGGCVLTEPSDLDWLQVYDMTH